jgi:hypothetical protein
MQKCRFHSQMSAPVGIGVKILAGTDVSPSCRSHCILTTPASNRRPSVVRDQRQLVSAALNADEFDHLITALSLHVVVDLVRPSC